MGVEEPGKYLMILFSALLIACLLVPGPALARTEARYELRTGNAVFGNDLYSSNSQQSLFHQQTANFTDIESLNIDFPAFADGLHLGPAATTIGAGAGVDTGTGIGIDSAGIGVGDSLGIGAGATASANIVPFGLVNLAFPDISQTVLQSYDVSSTGFYQANFLGIPPPNFGAALVTSGPGAFDSPVSPAPELVRDNLPFTEMYNIIPGYERQKAITKRLAAANVSANTTTQGTNNVTRDNITDLSPLLGRSIVDLPANDSVIRLQQSGAGTSLVIAGQEVAGLETSVPIDYAGHNVSSELLSYPYFPFAANSSTISNMTLLARIWRNSHLGTMGRAYEGDTSAPIWILPADYTKSAIAMYNWYNVNGAALNYTLPGTHLMPRFWDLGVANPYSPAYNMINNIGNMEMPAAVTDPDGIAIGGNRSMPALTNATANKTLFNAKFTVLGPKNVTGAYNNTSGISTPSPIATPIAQARYMPAGGPAGSGPGWDSVGPHQIAWFGGPNNPWTTAPSNNIYFPGRGGPDWPPFYWGFGRYKGY